MEKSPREHYAEIVSSQPDLRVRGNKMHYTAVNGNMFSFVAADNRMSLRLPQDQRDAFIIKHGTTLSVQHNTVMKEYVLIPEALLQKTAMLSKYFAASYDYAKSLKPKPTVKKTAKKTAKKKKAAKKKAAEKTAKKTAAKKTATKTANKAAAKKKTARKTAAKKTAAKKR